MKEIVGDRFPMTGSPALIVAGDSVGGNMAIAMALMSAMRHGPDIQKLLLYYPVTNACFDTPSYRQFAVDYYLYREGMKWFWEQYTTSMEDRDQITASPLRAGIDCLKCLPRTIIINGQADVLRSFNGMAEALVYNQWLTQTNRLLNFKKGVDKSINPIRMRIVSVLKRG